MRTVSVPETQALDHLGELPGDVRVLVWDGLDTAPDHAEEIEFFVGRYNAAPPGVSVLSGLPALRVVQLLSAGVDVWRLVVPAGVTLCNARGLHGASTAEIAVTGLLAVLRRIPEFVAAQAEARWDRLEGHGLSGRRALVVGAGDIGRRIGAVAELLGARVTYVAQTARDGVQGFDELPRLLPEHDVVVLAVPLTGQTHGMVDAGFLAAMPDGAMLVNIARGPVVDTDALCSELHARRLWAYLDVVDPEPLPSEHPLWRAPQLLLTPHVGGGTQGWVPRGYRMVGDQLRRHLAGESLDNQVTGDY